jgi:hypothetical protein
MTVLEVAIQGCPLDVYFTRFVSSGLFVQILAAVMNDNVPAARLRWANLEKENMIVSSQNMNIISRLALQNPELVMNFLRAVEQFHEVVPQFVERWAGPKVGSFREDISDDSLIRLAKLRVENSVLWVSQRYYERTIRLFSPISVQS